MVRVSDGVEDATGGKSRRRIASRVRTRVRVARAKMRVIALGVVLRVSSGSRKMVSENPWEMFHTHPQSACSWPGQCMDTMGLGVCGLRCGSWQASF